MPRQASGLSYPPLIVGMLVSGIDAGLLNGETTKVGMTVIPKERSGMASGVAGTVRFIGLVVGVAALGAVLYVRVTIVVAEALPSADAAARRALVQAITAGRLTAATLPEHDPLALQALAYSSFADGYRWLFIAAAAFTTLSALTWCLVSANDTPPVPPRRP